MPIDLVIGGDHGKVAFRESINPNITFTTGRNINIILRLAHVQFKKYNGEIMGNRGMERIG